jgi:exonuclease SbcC
VIPRSIKLKGFLCYRDEQTIDFDSSSTLWMLAGLNGSGKSAIFDAVTFVLFGHHRGGATGHQELINKDSDGFLIEFDLVLDNITYRIKRTLRRKVGGGSGSSTQQIFRLEGDRWIAIEGTNLKREFDAWVRNHIGLTYETFTSSVLLLQGDAERLLKSGPEGRRAVLASVVDLERYERLHRMADDRRKHLEHEVKALSSRLAATPAVEPLELAAADEKITQADEARNASRREVETLSALEFRAKAWQELQGRLAVARKRFADAQGLLGESDAIEQAAARLVELREALPHVQIVVEQRAAIHGSEAKGKDLLLFRQKQKEQLDERDNALKQATDKRGTLQNLISQSDTKMRDVSARLRLSTGRMGTLTEFERHDADLRQLRQELAQLPPDPAKDLTKARQAFETVETVARVLPLLDRFRRQREELRQALEGEQAADRKLQDVEARGKKCAAEVETLRPSLDEATRTAQRAGEQATVAKAELTQARDAVRELTQVGGAKVCRHCGQKLTPAHVKEEKARRAAASTAADDKALDAAKAHKAALAAEQALRERFTAAEKARQEAREQFTEARSQAKQAKGDIERLQAECARDYAELPDPYRRRVSDAAAADWSATTYPTAADVDAVRSEAAGAEAARARLRQAEQVQQRWSSIKAKESASLETLDRLKADLPAEPSSIRSEHRTLEAEEQTLQKNLEVNRDLLRNTERDIERLSKDREQIQSQITKIDGELKKEEVVQQHARQTADRTHKLLPEPWREPANRAGMRELSEWQKECDDLVRAGTDDKSRQLQHARLGLDSLRHEVDALEAQQSEFPEEARREPSAIQKQLAEARQKDRTCEDALGQARQHRALLENYRQQRQEIDEEYRGTEKELATQDLLAGLLGRDRLQLYLVRQAERQVVDHANAVLDRLSSGNLYLKLRNEAEGDAATGKALELEVFNRVTGEKPINVAFLSGSQKFRVAVSLALGIGQYASRLHRPIESVIIDEGFGCLDRFGRQVMIQEMQNLRTQMRCILLVSHQEEFADAFSDGYHFELEGGATRVRRFQK